MSLPEMNVNRLSRWPAILLFGMPGVGKGTQGSMLGTMSGMLHVSTGAIFRSLDPESEDGQEVGKYIHHGELVPDDVTIRIWRNWLDERIGDGSYDPQREVLILDGIPRSPRQCEMLEGHIEVLGVVHLECDDTQALIERLRGRGQGRADDTDEAIIRRRFEIYHAKTDPVLEYYAADRVHSVNPIGSLAQVTKRILEVVIPMLREGGSASDRIGGEG